MSVYTLLSLSGLFPHDVKMYNKGSRAREHLQNGSVACFKSRRCQMGGVGNIAAHNESYEV